MKPFVVAEVGSNWNDLNDCRASIQQAKNCGADAVKFQLFSHEELFGQKSGAIWKLGDAIVDHPSSLPKEWLPILKEKCDKVGIEFMCTAFSPEGYELINPLVKRHKIASAEMTHVRILEKVASFGKPVILSTGASGRGDITTAAMYLKELGVTDLTLLYCTAAYPARDVDFRRMDYLKGMGFKVGFSDHTTDYCEIPRAAVRHGATVYEKHFKLRDDMTTPDAPHALNVDEFKKMVDVIHGRDNLVWGSGEENDMVLQHNRRLIVTKDLKRGDVFQEGVNFGIYRSLKRDEHGLSPFSISRVNGQASLADIKAGDSIGPGDVD